MSLERSTKEAVSTTIVTFFAERPWLLAFLLVLTVSVATQGLLLESGGEVALEPDVLGDNDTNDGP